MTSLLKKTGKVIGLPLQNAATMPPTIPQPLCGYSAGAWSPSALYAGNEIWLYYNTGSGDCTADPICNSPALPPKILRSRMELDGVTRIDTMDFHIPQSCGSSNVDVAYAFGRVWMAANSTLNRIQLCTSLDGMNFLPYNGTDGILVDGGTNFVLTPHIEITSPTTLNLFFSQGGNPGNLSSVPYSNKWTIALSPASVQDQSQNQSKAQIVPAPAPSASCVAPEATQQYLTTALTFFSQAEGTPSLASQAESCRKAAAPVIESLQSQDWPCGTPVDQTNEYVQQCVGLIQQEAIGLSGKPAAAAVTPMPGGR